jgi:hypothetical protein
VKKFRIYNFLIWKWPGGNMTVDVRSIGHKWVYLRRLGRKRFTKITRSEWDQLSQNKAFEEVTC